MTALPLSVLIPTRNSMAQLPRHIAAAKLWLSRAEQIVIVDSASTDGTVEFLSRHLKELSPLILTHPPGLYESWNYGIGQCTARFIYISTIGDNIEADGLVRLINAAETFACDVVISPPRIVNENDGEEKRSWPIFEIIERLRLQDFVALGSEAVLLFAFSFMRKAFLGSSASNIYRTDCLKARPFPTDFGHAGDVGWGLRYAPEIRLGLVPEVFSTFLLHPKQRPERNDDAEDSGAKRFGAARETLRRVHAQLPPPAAALAGELCEAWASVFRSNREREALKRFARVAFFTPSGWKFLRQRKRAFTQLVEVQERAMQMLASCVSGVRER